MLVFKSHLPGQLPAFLGCGLVRSLAMVCLTLIIGFRPEPCLSGDPPITCIVFAPGGDSVLAGSQNGIVQYDWPSLNRRREFACTIGNLHDIEMSPNGDAIALVGGFPAESGSVEIISWPELKPGSRIEEHEDSIMSVTWMDPSTIISASLDHQILVCDRDSGTRLRQLSGHSKGLTTLCLIDEGSRLVSAGIDQNLRVWNVASGELIRSLNNHTLPVNSLALRPGDHPLAMVASASQDKTVRLWQPSIGRMVRFVRLDAVPLEVVWTVDGSWMVAACMDGKIRVIHPDTLKIAHELDAIDGWAYSVAVHPTDHSVLVGGSGGQLRRVRLPALE